MNIIELAKEAGITQSRTDLDLEYKLTVFAALVREQTLKDDKDLLTVYLVGFKDGQEEREWVDLTRDEAEALFWKWKHSSEYSVPLFEYRLIVDAVIAAFKEKNK